MKSCSLCHRVFDDSQIYCLDDGTPLVSEVASPSTELNLNSAETKKHSNIPYVFGVFVLVLGLGIFGAWMLLKSRLDPSGNNSNTQPVAAATPLPITTPTPTPIANVMPPANANDNSNAAAANTETVSVSKPNEQTDPTTLPPVMKAEDHSVQFNLHQCKKSGSSIECFFTITNKGDDRRLQLRSYNTNVFDELGNTYRANRLRLANEEGDYPEINFISGVTTKARAEFADIDPKGSKITLLNIEFNVGNDRGLNIKFRNVPLVISR